jgi:hypothetical protein
MLELYHNMQPHPSTAYLGGFIDGEGSIGIIGGSIALRVSNTNLAILQELQSIWGGTICDHTKPTDVVRQCWQWVTYGQVAADALEDLFPHLREKRMQAFMALEYRTLSKASPMRGWIRKEISTIKHLDTKDLSIGPQLTKSGVM